MFRRRAIIIAATLAVAAAFSGAASAATTNARPARATAAVHARVAVKTARAAGLKASAEDSEAGVCANCTPPLLYTAGGYVMGGGGTITVTPIYWAPGGNSAFDNFDATYRSLINRYITDVAAASGSTGIEYGILPEYYQTVNGTTTKIKYSIAAGTPMTDTDAYPTTGQCTAVNGPAGYPLVNNYTACITDAQLQAELKAYLTANKLPTGLNNFYPVFFPPNVQTNSGTGAAAQYSNNDYCGYHSVFATGPASTLATNAVIYGNEPFPGVCYSGTTPNNDQYADAAIDTLSHELDESITDPIPAGGYKGWQDSSGNENGDECAYNYGPALGTVSTANNGMQPYNQVINGDKYYTQTEFSNAAYKATGVGTGCRQSAYTTSMGPRREVRHDQAGLATQLTVDASPSSLPADGSSTATVTITATDANGDPVAGDPISVVARDDIATPPAGCGTLSNGPPGPGDVLTTDAAGQVTVTYTAASASGDCYILATDTMAGITDQALIYQGSDEPAAPAITQSTLPSQLVSGGPAATFTATAANPSGGSHIHDARFGVYITGDDTASAGINASQLTLTYKDDATQGDYITVPLTGTTTDGGQISGLVSPDTAEALAAGDTRDATFQLSLAGNAVADTAATGNNLQIQIILDQIDPADGSLSNLDMTTPGDVPVVQEPGDTITYSGKLVTTSPPSGSTPGTAELEAKTCTFASDNAACRLTGTASFTASGGTLTGTITTDPAAGVPDLVINFTETFTTSPGGGAGTGTGQVIYFDNGNYSTQNLSAVYQTSQDKANPNIQETQGTLTFTNPTP